MIADDKILLSFLEEKAIKCSDCNMITCSRFLDMHERSLASSLKLPQCIKRIFYGGFEDSERTVAVFFPDYAEVNSSEDAERYFESYPEDCPIKILEITKDKFSKPLGHRDYLGAVMGLGVNRDVTGDIIVNDMGCFMAVAENMADYIAENMSKAGRGTLTIKVKYPSEIKNLTKQEGMPDSFTVSSPRLDSIIKNGFGVSRDVAAESIEHGLVFVNDLECVKPDKKINNGDKITFRHKGRIIIENCDELSKKGRNIVKILKF